MEGTQQNNGVLGAVPGLQQSNTPLAQLMAVLSQIPRQGAQQGNPSAQPQLQAPDAGAALAALNQHLAQQSSGGQATPPFSNPQTWSMFGGGGNPLGLSNGSQFTPADLQNLQTSFAAGNNQVAPAALTPQAPSYLSQLGSVFGM